MVSKAEEKDVKTGKDTENDELAAFDALEKEASEFNKVAPQFADEPKTISHNAYRMLRLIEFSNHLSLMR